MATSQSNKRGARFKDLTGSPPFGRLVVQSFSGMNQHGKATWLCLCDPSFGGCGATCVVIGASLTGGHSQSCGCGTLQAISKANTTHGKTATAEYRSWYGMKARCTNPKNIGYPNYGGRGISVCERWLTFEPFLADMGAKPSPAHTIDRIDNNGNYEPGNCRWATRSSQARNNRRNRMLTFRGETRCLTDWAAQMGVDVVTLHCRLSRGLSVEESLIP